MAAQATGAGGDGDDTSATGALGASRGGWPGQSAEDGHGGPAPLRPGPGRAALALRELLLTRQRLTAASPRRAAASRGWRGRAGRTSY